MRARCIKKTDRFLERQIAAFKQSGLTRWAHSKSDAAGVGSGALEIITGNGNLRTPRDLRAAVTQHANHIGSPQFRHVIAPGFQDREDPGFSLFTQARRD
ncbi:hypothetical protein LMG27198_28810 [Methylocystis echinoides]|uniref:Uncharacterized protein n=1 Tax=Methylocystis echinoides TaxID=29468 RepID=A0A9W6GVY7_9HYPH|nr:hypothetical protein LMG27198_28810 [Methylocystis echinoides]